MSQVSLGFSRVLAGSTAEPQRQFFDVAPLKLFVMSVVTFGLYQIYWFYRNWKVRKDLGADVSPVLRGIFAPLFAFSLFKEIQDEAGEAGVRADVRPGAMALLYFLFQIASRLPDPLWLVSFLSVLPLMVVQRDIAAIHRARALDPSVNDGVSWLNIIGIAIGGIMLLLVGIGMVAIAAE